MLAKDGQYGHQHDPSHDGIPEIVTFAYSAGFSKMRDPQVTMAFNMFQHYKRYKIRSSMTSKSSLCLGWFGWLHHPQWATAGTAGRPWPPPKSSHGAPGQGPPRRSLGWCQRSSPALGPMVPSNFLAAKNDIVCVSYMYIFNDTYNVCIINIYIYIKLYIYHMIIYICVYIYIMLYIIYVSGSWGFNHHLPIPGGSSSWNSDTPRSPRDLPGCWMLLLEMMVIYGVHSWYIDY